tara:strand:- start:483 stop:923 length:441 start_codon:yes stop_codon:yes gene_type:complete
MNDKKNNLAPLILFSEIATIDQLIRAQISKILPDGMAISHLSVLNHLSSIKNEKNPMQLAKSFNVTKGAMTNTLSKLEASGYINIRPDWNDARKKQITISKSGIEAQREATKSITPILNKVINMLGKEKADIILPIIRELRNILSK